MLTDHHEILTLSYDKQLQCVIMSWNGFASSSEFRAANEQVLTLLLEMSCHNVIADCREMKIISITDQQWLYQNWIPRATRAGLKYAAIVESADFFNRLSVDNVVQQVNEQLTIKYFSGILSARSWISRIND